MRKSLSPRPVAAWLAAVLAIGALVACGGAGEEPAEEHHDEGHHEDEHHDEGPAGVVEISAEAIERIGLATERAAPRALDGRRGTTGEVGFDETRLAHVTPRVEGRLVAVPAELGHSVARGAVLAVLDSVELGEAKAAYLRARARREVVARAFERESSLYEDQIVSEQRVLDAEAESREASADLAAARERLRLLGLDDGEIDALAWDDPEASRVAVRSPFAGRVVEREATLGELVDPEHRLFTVADLSTVWLWIDLYERDLAHVGVGDRVEVRFDALPGETHAGAVAYVADQLDPGSRTVRARVDLPNPERRFKPGMFARVDLGGPAGAAPEVLTVPREAVQRDGGAAVVFVRVGPRRFERRAVEIGRITDEHAEVLAGLAAGDEVVTRGVFLLQSEASAESIGGHHH
jgi:membrane fusion protein, heavy metal efflux system